MPCPSSLIRIKPEPVFSVSVPVACSPSSYGSNTIRTPPCVRVALNPPPEAVASSADTRSMCEAAPPSCTGPKSIDATGALGTRRAAASSAARRICGAYSQSTMTLHRHSRANPAHRSTDRPVAPSYPVGDQLKPLPEPPLTFKQLPLAAFFPFSICLTRVALRAALEDRDRRVARGPFLNELLHPDGRCLAGESSSQSGHLIGGPGLSSQPVLPLQAADLRRASAWPSRRRSRSSHRMLAQARVGRRLRETARLRHDPRTMSGCCCELAERARLWRLLAWGDGSADAGSDPSRREGSPAVQRRFPGLRVRRLVAAGSSAPDPHDGDRRVGSGGPPRRARARRDD